MHEEKDLILEMRNISKSFPGVKALEDVSISLHSGEVLALIGENGAGKSTLMNVLMGIYQPDVGQILINGMPVNNTSPSDALNNGIAMIYQELNPVQYMTIAENIFLNREDHIGRTPFVDFKTMNSKAQKLLDEYGIHRSAKTKMANLSVAECQMIEIIKAVDRNSKIIVMDEATSSLSDEETKKLFETIFSLKEKGVGIIYISHRMEEVFELADRITILRDGRLVETVDSESASSDYLISRMVGRELNDLYPKIKCDTGDVLLEVKNFSRKGVFENVSFKVSAGEIVGLSGLVGAGRSEIVRAIYGLDPHDSGEVYIEGKAVKIHTPRDAINLGIAMVSEDRKQYGLVLCRNIRENISLTHLKMFIKGLFIRKKEETEACERFASKLSLKMSGLNQTVGNLSGGNQQKVVLAKCLLKTPKILILDEPTRGIDVGAKSEIHRMMSELAAEGIAIIMISSEMPEILGMSDRILVVSNGRIKKEFYRGAVTQEDILEVALGGK